MKVVVIGGTNFLGPGVVRDLGEAGHRVTIVHSGAHEVQLPQVDHVHVGRDQIRQARDELARLRADVVVHMHAMSETNARDLVDVFRGVAGRLVAVSSADVYRAYGRLQGTEPGQLEPIPLDEDAPMRERLYPYRQEAARADDDPERWLDDYDKVLVERIVRSHPDLPGTIVRPCFVHGPRWYRYYDYVRRMLDGRPAIFLGAGLARFLGTRCYSEDVAHGIALAATDERAAGRVYNVGEPTGRSEAELVRLLAHVTGWSGELVEVEVERVPEWLRQRLPSHLREPWPGQPLVTDTSRIRRELGYAERLPAEEGLRRTVEWMRSHPTDEMQMAMLQGFDYGVEDELLASIL